MDSTKEPQKRGRPFVSGDARANPGGRPRMQEASRTLLADAEPKAIKAYIDGLSATKSAVSEGVIITSEIPDHAVRKTCADALLARRLGQPAQAITGEDGGPIQIEGVDLTALNDAQFAALVALRDALKAK